MVDYPQDLPTKEQRMHHEIRQARLEIKDLARQVNMLSGHMEDLKKQISGISDTSEGLDREQGNTAGSHEPMKL